METMDSSDWATHNGKKSERDARLISSTRPADLWTGSLLEGRKSRAVRPGPKETYEKIHDNQYCLSRVE